MTQHVLIKRAGTIQKAERKVLRFFNHKSGAGIVAASVLTFGTGMTTIISLADKHTSTEQTTAGDAYTQQFTQEVAHIARDIRSITLVETQQGLVVAQKDQARVAHINSRIQNLTTRIAFNTAISEATVASLMSDLSRDSIIVSKNYSLASNPVFTEQTRSTVRKLGNRAPYRDEALRDLANKTPTPDNVARLVAKMGDKEGSRIDWLAAGIFLGLPLGGTAIVLTGQTFALRRQRKTDQQERTEISYDTMQDIKKKMTPKTTVRVSYGNKP